MLLLPSHSFHGQKLDRYFMASMMYETWIFLLHSWGTHPAFGMLYLYEKRSVLESENWEKQNMVGACFPYRSMYTTFSNFGCPCGSQMKKFLIIWNRCYIFHISRIVFLQSLIWTTFQKSTYKQMILLPSLSFMDKN